MHRITTTTELLIGSMSKTFREHAKNLSSGSWPDPDFFRLVVAPGQKEIAARVVGQKQAKQTTCQSMNNCREPTASMVYGRI